MSHAKKPSTLPKRPSGETLILLDDPEELGDLDATIGELSPDTARPNFEPIIFAKEIESAEDRATAPPAPTYDMLRDSCKTKIVQAAPLDEEQILRPSSEKIKTTRR
jgi:hypothetical protein